jgi:hypothetical protein
MIISKFYDLLHFMVTNIFKKEHETLNGHTKMVLMSMTSFRPRGYSQRQQIGMP